MNNLLIHPAMKAGDVKALLQSLGLRLVSRDSNIVQLRAEQEKRRLANSKPAPVIRLAHQPEVA